MRAQMEMIGLAFVVVIMVLGIMIYVVLSAASPAKMNVRNIQEADLFGKMLETAMLETTIPTCGYSLGIALDRCITKSYLSCSGGNVCEEAFFAFEEMIESSLGAADDIDARSYRAYILIEDEILVKQGFEFLLEPFADCNENSDVYAAPQQPLHTSAGDARFVVEFCS